MNAALVLTALFNAAWQGAVLSGAAYIVFRRMRGLNATTMFTVWSVLLAICIALPFGNYEFAARPYTVRIAPAVHTHSSVPETTHMRVHPIVAAQSVAAPQPSLRDRALKLSGDLMQRAWIVLLLLSALALLRLTLLARDLLCMFAARRAAHPIDLPLSAPLAIPRPFQFATSGDLRSPCVLGFLPALIVLPEDVLRASHDELLSVVFHEAEHVRRYDDVQNLVHRVISAVGFFLPGVTIALRELALYRERICDDAAIARMGDPVGYATTLTDFAQWALGSGVPVPSFIFKRKQLIQRLEMLLDRAVNHSLRIDGRFAVSAALTLLIASAIVLRVQVPVIAQEFVISAPHHRAVPKPLRHAVRIEPIAQIAHLEHVQNKPSLAPVIHAAELRPVAKVPPAAPGMHAARAKHTAHTARATRVTAVAIAPVALSKVAISPLASAVAPVAIAPATSIRQSGSDAMLSALEAAGLTHLSVDDLIALRDHGVNPALVSSAHAYFGSSLSAKDLVRLADSRIDPAYLEALRAAGESGACADDVVRLRDHGVTAAYITRIRAYNPRASLNDIIRLHDSGF